MRNRIIRTAVAAALLCAAGFAPAAQATDLYITTSSAWIDGSAGSINGVIHYAANPGGEAAAIGRIRLIGTDQDGNAASIPVYCVDVADWLGNGTFHQQTLDTLSFSATQLSQIVRFITYTDALVESATGGQKTIDSAAAQLGVWEILNETAANWGLTTGSFYVTQYDSAAIFDAASQADAWLAMLKDGDMPTDALHLLAVLDPGPGNQKQVFITGRGNDQTNIGSVPEPSTWGTIVLGFGALGAALRRRREQRTLVA